MHLIHALDSGESLEVYIHEHEGGKELPVHANRRPYVDFSFHMKRDGKTVSPGEAVDDSRIVSLYEDAMDALTRHLEMHAPDQHSGRHCIGEPKQMITFGYVVSPEAADAEELKGMVVNALREKGFEPSKADRYELETAGSALAMAR